MSIDRDFKLCSFAPRIQIGFMRFFLPNLVHLTIFDLSFDCTKHPFPRKEMEKPYLSEP